MCERTEGRGMEHLSSGCRCPRGLPRSATVLSATVLSAIVLVALAVGCSPGTSAPRPTPSRSTSRTKPTSCGSARTAANVPVDVEIAAGSVPCATAISVEQDYANAIRSGKAPGNGGGGPVQVKGWTCQGFATPVVLKTGRASKCVRDGEEILAILPPPSD